MDLYLYLCRFEVGFATGLVMSASGFAFSRYISRLRTIDVESVMSDALEMIQTSPEVVKQMGLSGLSYGSVQTGTLRVYQIEPGGLTQASTTGLPSWTRPKIQLMFQVWGGANGKQAVVCCEASTKPTNTAREFSFLSFDLLEKRSGDQGKNPTILVVGDESNMHIRNDLRAFATLHKVYVQGLE